MAWLALEPGSRQIFQRRPNSCGRLGAPGGAAWVPFQACGPAAPSVRWSPNFKMATDTKEQTRGICCHEAGHAVVAFWFNVPVEAAYVTFSEEKGWHGGTDTPHGSAGHLDYMDQVTILVAGKAAEDFFDCRAHETAWRDDLGQSAVLLDAKGIPEGEHWTRITEACERAQSILATHHDKVLNLIDLLAEDGRVERLEFLRLMNGETP